MSFRTPLNAILNSFEFIESALKSLEKLIPIDEARMEKQKTYGANEPILKNLEHAKKFVSIGTNSSVLLFSLIEDILDLSRIEGGTFKINLAPFKIENILKE
jgi:signal transduction histidine kinase